MRITEKKIAIEYEKTKAFYDHRAEKYNEEHPYISIMFQDQHPEIAEQRNQAEISRILPMLNLNKQARVLDLGCGIGRWADAISEEIAYYLGCDFSENLIEIANARNCKKNFNFATVSAMEAATYCKQHNIQRFSHIIISGMMIYLNDEDVQRIFQSLSELTLPNATVYIREAMGIEARLTLKDFYSEELQHEYNTIYRTQDEYREMIETYAPDFTISAYGPMFEQAALNNRKETAQFYFILHKN